MKTEIPEETLFKLAKASAKSKLRTQAATVITRHFKSIHYLSSILICDCVVLNVLLNDSITPTSADEIITCIRRRNKSMYTTVDSAYFPIETRFEEYAKSVLGNDYAAIKNLNMRTTNFIVYVLSLDLSANYQINTDEVYSLAYTYEELKQFGGNLPHYR